MPSQYRRQTHRAARTVTVMGCRSVCTHRLDLRSSATTKHRLTVCRRCREGAAVTFVVRVPRRSNSSTEGESESYKWARGQSPEYCYDFYTEWFS